jgi:hypothetical protein
MTFLGGHQPQRRVRRGALRPVRGITEGDRFEGAGSGEAPGMAGKFPRLIPTAVSPR